MLGHPVGHSRSPALHRAAYAALGLREWCYDPIECTEAEFPDFLSGVDPGAWAGLSLTMPLKRVALAAATERSCLAEAVGAANTLVPRDNGWYADNTDVSGMVAALREAGLESVHGGVILGAGGTAQAALAALRELGEFRPTVLVREPARAGELRSTAERLGVTPEILRGLNHSALDTAPLVISTVPAGAADALAERDWRPTAPGTAFVLDVLYHPWPTPLAAAARQAGRVVVSGLDLLLHQAVGQVRLMTGATEVPVEAMRAALR